MRNTKQRIERKRANQLRRGFLLAEGRQGVIQRGRFAVDVMRKGKVRR